MSIQRGGPRIGITWPCGSKYGFVCPKCKFELNATKIPD